MKTKVRLKKIISTGERYIHVEDVLSLLTGTIVLSSTGEEARQVLQGLSERVASLIEEKEEVPEVKGLMEEVI